MAAGSISASEFQNVVSDFLAVSSRLNDGWTVDQVQDEVYLWKKSVVARKLEEEEELPSPVDEELTVETESLEEQEDLACLYRKGDNPVDTYEYHVVYSGSYGVPVLYFNAYTSSGKLLSLEDVWSRVPRHYRDRLEGERWTFLTQQEHPLLGRPFYQLHPCHTATLMSKLPASAADSTGNYLISWLSAVGPVAGLTLPMTYGQALTDR